MHLENETGEEANPTHKTLKVLFLVLCHFFTVVCKILHMSYDHNCILCLWRETDHFLVQGGRSGGCVSVSDQCSITTLFSPPLVANSILNKGGQLRLIWGEVLRCTVNDKSLDVISSDLQLLLHGVKGDLLEFHRHAHECQQAHLGHVLLMRQAWRATRRDH